MQLENYYRTQIPQQKLANIATQITLGQLMALHLGRLKDTGKLTPAMVSMGKRNNVALALETEVPVVSYWELAAAEVPTSFPVDASIGHAGEAETSMMLAAFPELVGDIGEADQHNRIVVTNKHRGSHQRRHNRHGDEHCQRHEWKARGYRCQRGVENCRVNASLNDQIDAVAHGGHREHRGLPTETWKRTLAAGIRLKEGTTTRK